MKRERSIPGSVSPAVPGRGRALLFLPPTRPRGGMPLSLATVAAWLRPALDVRIADLNVLSDEETRAVLDPGGAAPLCGLGVSAQTLEAAIRLTGRIRATWPEATVVWGGELPTLLPRLCLQHADSVVCGRFEPLAETFLADLLAGSLRRTYGPSRWEPGTGHRPPALDAVEHRDRYPYLLGEPLETSLGCDHGCSFCLVHAMQRHAAPFPIAAVEADLAAHPRAFVNVVDYNLGSDREHLLRLAACLERSPVAGWTGELCIEALGDEEVLRALARSRCRVVYCGLEAVEQAVLRGIRKGHNRVDQYAGLVGKAHSHGIEVASGFILGLEGTTPEGFERYLRFCEDAGIVYLKLTWLTFNPGTRIHAAMKRKGRYLTDDVSRFDGNNPTYLPDGVDLDMVRRGARHLVERFYSNESAWTRSRHLESSPFRRAEFMLLSRLFGTFYEDGGVLG